MRANRYRVRSACSEACRFAVYGADAERYTAAAGAPQCVEQAFVMAEEEEIDAAECDGRESDSRTFVRDYGQQADYQGEERSVRPSV